MGAFDVYDRKADGAECAYRYFPRPFGAIDWSGHGLPLPMPLLADEELTKPLPHGNYFKPIWFKSEPKPAALDVLRDAKREKEEAEAAADGFRIEEIDFERATE